TVTRQDAMMGIGCRILVWLVAIIVFACPMDGIAGISPRTSATIQRPESINRSPSQLPQFRQPVNDSGGSGSGFAEGSTTRVGNSNSNSDQILPTPERDPNACNDEHGDLAPAMVVLPPGHFRMGSPEDEPGRFTNESPQHWVTLRKPFALGSCEITVGQFRRFVEETGYVTELEKPEAQGCVVWDAALKKYEPRKGSHWRQSGFPQTEHHPVVCVTYADALAYADWLSHRTGGRYRLPTEAEWEYAVRATPKIDRPLATARYWGEVSKAKQQCDYANGADQSAQSISGKDWRLADCQDGYAYTAPVASFRPTLLGLYDLLGNVWEWTSDCWHEDYTGAPVDGSAWLEAKQSDCQHRVIRGGSWYYVPQILRSADRYWYTSVGASFDLGFRLARDF
ncbi:MAG: formylglycine-generating enzyme family protein, partial [Candidatus Methylumidiphilus sp.]